MRLQSVLMCGPVIVLAVMCGCASTGSTAPNKVSSQPAQESSPVAPSASAPASAAATSAAATPATKAAVVQPSWWTKPAPAIEGRESLIAQADAAGAALAKEAAIDAGRTKLEQLGADTSRMEVVNATVTKVRFDGPFRAFVLVSAPKGR